MVERTKERTIGEGVVKMKYSQNFKDILQYIHDVKFWNLLVGVVSVLFAIFVSKLNMMDVYEMILHHNKVSTNLLIFIVTWFFSWIVSYKFITWIINQKDSSQLSIQKLKSITNTKLLLNELVTLLCISEINKLEFYDAKIKNHQFDLDSKSLGTLCRFGIITFIDSTIHNQGVAYGYISRYEINKRTLKWIIKNNRHIENMIAEILKTRICDLFNKQQISVLLNLLEGVNAKPYMSQSGFSYEVSILNDHGLLIDSDILINVLKDLKDQVE